ncbi:hypothetical protein ASE39_24625 [Acidovorax sp. Root267]|nr:hypothetical protein ASE39_24625 [Acidovorax sp. Root267]
MLLHSTVQAQQGWQSWTLSRNCPYQMKMQESRCWSFLEYQYFPWVCSESFAGLLQWLGLDLQ